MEYLLANVNLLSVSETLMEAKEAPVLFSPSILSSFKKGDLAARFLVGDPERTNLLGAICEVDRCSAEEVSSLLPGFCTIVGFALPFDEASNRSIEDVVRTTLQSSKACYASLRMPYFSFHQRAFQISALGPDTLAMVVRAAPEGCTVFQCKSNGHEWSLQRRQAQVAPSSLTDSWVLVRMAAHFPSVSGTFLMSDLFVIMCSFCYADVEEIRRSVSDSAVLLASPAAPIVLHPALAPAAAAEVTCGSLVLSAPAASSSSRSSAAPDFYESANVRCPVWRRQR